MNAKLRDAIFLCLCISLPFIYLPPEYQYFKFFGGSFSSSLAYYPALFGLLCTAYWSLKNNKKVFNKSFLLFSCVYCMGILISLIFGLIKYPYYDWLFEMPRDQFNGLSILHHILENNNFYIEYKTLLVPYMLVSFLKNTIIDYLWSFGLAYLVYFWYKDDFKKGFALFFKGVLISAIIIAVYSFLDIGYLLRNETATNLLILLNPYIHSIKIHHGWYPPLLSSGNALRSVFTEQGFIGNYISYFLPMIYSRLLYVGDFIVHYSIIVFTYGFMVILTKARTAMAIQFGILGVFFAVIWLEHFNKIILKKYLLILICCASSFFVGVLFLSYSNSLNNTTKNVVNNSHISLNEEAIGIIDNNLISLGKKNARSNAGRYAAYKSSLRAFIENPILGVGNGLSGAYVIDHFSDEDKKDVEVKLWINDFHKQGAFKAGINAMNEYIVTLTEQGIVGFVLKFFPFVYVVYNLFNFRRNLEFKWETMALITMLFVNLVAVINGGLKLFHSPWVLLGLAYACLNSVIMSRDNKD